MWLSAKAEKARETKGRRQTRLSLRCSGAASPLGHHPDPSRALFPELEGGQGRTAGVVWGCIQVVDVGAAWLGHLQVHHVGGVLQSSHCLFMPYLLQVGVVHLGEGGEGKEQHTGKL